MIDAPALKPYLRWRVAIQDEEGSRVVLVPPKQLAHEGVVVDLDQGILHAAATDVRHIVSKGVWTDQGLPTVEQVLGKVEITL